MAWPPTIPPATRTDATDQLSVHPADHNAISAALTDMVAGMARRIGSNSTVAAIAGIAATESANIISTSVPVVTGRKYRVLVYLPVVYSSAAADTHNLRLYADAANLTNSGWTSAGANYATPLTLWTEYTAAATATVVFSVRAIRASGAGTGTVGGKAGDPARITVDDVGTI